VAVLAELWWIDEKEKKKKKKEEKSDSGSGTVRSVAWGVAVAGW
jgi:hypothetical protein